MVKTKFKKAVSLMLAAVMSLTAFTGIGATTAFAAVGEKADVYLVDYPRSGDTNNNGEWGHGNLNYMNGWKGLSTKYTGLRAMGSYSGNIAYCIEPGTGQRTGDTLTEKDENFFNNISPNGTISGDDIRLLIGRILQYGYRGGISTSWKSQNESDANCIAHAYATQILIWETIVGERDAGFNHVSTSGYNAVLECVSTAHPLRSKILSYYNSMVTSVQNHTKVPSFCTRSSGSAKVNELEYDCFPLSASAYRSWQAAHERLYPCGSAEAGALYRVGSGDSRQEQGAQVVAFPKEGDALLSHPKAARAVPPHCGADRGNRGTEI